MAQSETKCSLLSPIYAYRVELPTPTGTDLLLSLFLATLSSPKPIPLKVGGIRAEPPFTDPAREPQPFINLDRDLVVLGAERVLQLREGEEGYEPWLVDGELVGKDGKRQRIRARIRGRGPDTVMPVEARPAFIEMPRNVDAGVTEWRVSAGPNALQLLNNLLDLGSKREVAVSFGTYYATGSSWSKEVDIPVNVFGAYRVPRPERFGEDQWYLRGWCDGKLRLPPATLGVDARPDAEGRHFVEIEFNTHSRGKGTFRRCNAPSPDLL